jgi:hypothetical protein
MLDVLRTTLHRAITTRTGDGLAPIRVQKDLARRLNRVLGQPLCSAEELETRKAARARLAELRRIGGTTKITREAAPVTIYFEKDRNVRDLERMRDTLRARSIGWKELDVTGDETTLDFVCRTAKVKGDELPVVFVGPTAVGGLRALVALDASGELVKAVW